MQQVSMSGSSFPPPPPPLCNGDGSGGNERRRTIRIRRSSLLEAKLDGLDRPSIKIAETLDEYIQAFRVLHDVYKASGYVKKPADSGLLFCAQHLLPKTCVFVFKTYLSVIATMSYMPDTPEFGLPMDELYLDEIDKLRQKGRRVVEVGSLATIPHRRCNNLMALLSKAIFTYALATGADDLCIMVNPKHVRFYNRIFLFEFLGEERFYQKVGAPAVALRANMRTIEPALYAAYHSDDFDTDLHAFFVKVNANPLSHDFRAVSAEKSAPLGKEVARALLKARPDLLGQLSDVQAAYLESMYPEAMNTADPVYF